MTARTPAGTPLPAARITILDILRALALLGIVIVHTHDHFNLYLPMPPAEGWQAAANSAADWAYEHLFVSKSFLLFSFLFGLSFFIQLDRREQQGIDFRKRFMWRLTLLFLLGLAHTLFYDGDILTLFGTLGFALVMLYKCGTPLLITLCALCLIQPVMLMDLLNHAGLAAWWPHSSGWFHTGSPAAGPHAGIPVRPRQLGPGGPVEPDAGAGGQMAVLPAQRPPLADDGPLHPGHAGGQMARL